ncbi:hypothetical protein Tco_0656392 [Tanacetum coccineum]|uniref:Uncharacterized protein n=1 Tax=Tanacetum coccineum TaxID=301880 RepID=A0ABQ4X9C7_9ASTR
MEALIEDENAMDKGVADTIKDHKRKHDDNEDDDDEDHLARPKQGKKTKRRRTKESESSQKPSTTKETPKAKAPTKGSKTHKFASAKEPVEEPIAEVIMDDAADDVQPPRPPTPDPEWNKRQTSLIGTIQKEIVTRFIFPSLFLYKAPGHRIVAADYFFNNDLEYLKTSDPEVTYTTSIMKTKAAQYEIKGIEDMVSKFSKQNVYSTKAILGMKSVSVKKLHGYGHLEEIVVKRSDQQLYKFKECDFSDIVDFIVALCMFTRSLILKRRVEDLQLGVENLDKQKRVLRADELYKFLDGTLKSVRDEIHHRVLDFHLDYNPEMPKRKWKVVDRKRSGLMIELIDKQLRERKIIRNLERLVGARELEMDYKLMTHIV